MKARAKLGRNSTQSKLIVSIYRVVRTSAIFVLNIVLILNRGRSKRYWKHIEIEFERVTNPLVSIILPTYNHGEFLKSAIEKILGQDYKNIELIIINDGSEDHTSQILADFHHDTRVKVIHQNNQGLPKALNNGFRIARGDFFTWTSADNLMGPNCISQLLKVANNNSNIGLVYSDFQAIEVSGNLMSAHNPWRIYDRDNKKSIVRLKQARLFYKNIPINYIGPYFLYRASLARILEGYSDIPGIEDWDYWLRMQFVTKFQHVKTDGLQYQYRVHSNSMSNHLGVENNLVNTIRLLAKITTKRLNSDTLKEAITPMIAEETYLDFYSKNPKVVL